MNKNLFWLILFCVCLPVLLILFSYQATVFFTDYTAEQEKVLDYLHGDVVDVEMTAAEQMHLQDVKILMDGLGFVFYFFWLMVVMVVLVSYKKKDELKKMFLYGGISTAGTVVLLMLIGLISFKWLFTIFHKIFFPQGNWQFGAETYLIQAFPFEFFGWMAMKISLLTLLLASIFILAGIFYNKSK